MVLYFYPADETMGCTVEACAFRDAHQAFVERDAQIVGVSRDSPDSHAASLPITDSPSCCSATRRGEVHNRFGIGKRAGHRRIA